MTTPTNVNTEAINAAIQGTSVGNAYLIDPDTGQPYAALSLAHSLMW